MIFDQLEKCPIETCKEIIQVDEFIFKDTMHVYQNEGYVLAFEKFLIYVINKESGKKIHTFKIEKRGIVKPMALKSDTLIVLDENNKQEKIELTFVEQCILEDYNDAISPFLEMLRDEENNTTTKRMKKEIIAILACVLFLTAIGYFCYLKFFSHIKEEAILVHVFQTLPIVLVCSASLLQLILLFKNYVAEKTLLLYNLLVFIISLPQLFLLSSFMVADIEIGKEGIFQYYLVFITILCITVFIVTASYFIRKRVVPLASKKKNGGVGTIVVAVVVMVFMMLLLIPSLEIEIGDYFKFLYYFFMIGLFITIAFNVITQSENKIPRITLTLFLGILSFLLAFPTSLNSNLMYPYKKAPTSSEMSSYQKTREKNQYWFGNKDVANVQMREVKKYVDGYEVDDSDTKNRLFVKSIQSVKVKSDNVYELELTYSDGIHTREIWKKNHETKKMEYVRAAMRDERPVVSAEETRKGNYRYFIIIPIEGTSKDLYHNISPKKQVGENTITIEKCHFPNDNNACVTLRDKSGNVIVGGIDYASEESKMMNQVIGYIGRYDEQDVYRYQFNEDGTYTYTKVDKEELNKCKTTHTADEVVGQAKLTQSQMDILKKDCTYKGNNQVHTVILNNQKEESVLLFNNDGKFLVENAISTYAGVDGVYLLKQVKYTDGELQRYYSYYAKYNTQLTDDTAFNSRKFNGYVYWNNKEYFFRNYLPKSGDELEKDEKDNQIAKFNTLYDNIGNPIGEN